MRQGVQHITLVFLPVFSPQQQPPSGFFIKFYIGIVACGNIVAAQFLPFGEQLPQLHMFVAVHTGIGCPPAFIFCNEVIDHMLTEAIAEVKHVMGETKLLRSAFSICNIRNAGISLILKPDVPAVKHFQCDTHNIIARFLQQQSRHGTVHPAAHGH